MLLTTLIKVLALAVTAYGAAVPQDIPDGLYRKYINENGTEVTEQLESPFDTGLQTRNEAASILATRDNNVLCGCGYFLDSGNCDAAVADLTGQLDRSGHIQPYMSYYSIRGGVVAFSCNARASIAYITGGVYASELAAITSQCGRYIAGTLGDNYLQSGYMQYHSGLDFCAAATYSNLHYC